MTHPAAELRGPKAPSETDLVTEHRPCRAVRGCRAWATIPSPDLLCPGCTRAHAATPQGSDPGPQAVLLLLLGFLLTLPSTPRSGSGSHRAVSPVVPGPWWPHLIVLAIGHLLEESTSLHLLPPTASCRSGFLSVSLGQPVPHCSPHWTVPYPGSPRLLRPCVPPVSEVLLVPTPTQPPAHCHRRPSLQPWSKHSFDSPGCALPTGGHG